MNFTEGTPVVVISGPYCDDEGTVYSTEAPEGFVRVHFPQYGRRIVEMRISRLDRKESDNPA